MKRPKGVTIIALWDFAGSAFALISSVFLFFPDKPDPVLSPILLLGAVALLVLGIGLWKMKNWARVFTTIGTVLSLLAGLVMTAVFPELWDFSAWRIAHHAAI